MPRQHTHQSRITCVFPDAFPERLKRFKEKSHLPWSELNRRLGTHPQTIRHWRDRGCGPAYNTRRRYGSWPTLCASATYSPTEGASARWSMAATAGSETQKGPIHACRGRTSGIAASSPCMLRTSAPRRLTPPPAPVRRSAPTRRGTGTRACRCALAFPPVPRPEPAPAKAGELRPGEQRLLPLGGFLPVAVAQNQHDRRPHGPRIQ